MKKILCLFFILILFVSSTAFAVDTYSGYHIPVDIAVNDCLIRCVEKPIMVDGTTYIPLRAFSDAVGGSISWDEVNRAAVMGKDGHSFLFYPDENRCVIDGAATDYSVVLYENLTFIPVRAVCET